MEIPKIVEAVSNIILPKLGEMVSLKWIDLMGGWRRSQIELET